MKKYLLAAGMFIALSTLFAFTAPTAWKIGTNYTISFSTSGVSGIFKTLTGNIQFDEQNVATSKFDISIDINSINTGNGMQNKHAKGAEWFDAAKYPAIKFTSSKISKTSTGYNATGSLQIHGITKEINLPFVFKKAGAGGVFEGSFNVNRSEFKIGEAGGEVGEIIKINVSVPVTK